MESFLNRYRNITVLLLVIFAQLVLLAMQVKNDQDVRFIRIWAVTTVTPVARIVEWFRGGSIGFVRHYVLLHDASEAAERVLRMLREGIVRAVDGSDVPLAVDTVCVHGDNPGAVAFARKLHEALESSGVAIAAT